jgi:hypothetical protein
LILEECRNLGLPPETFAYFCEKVCQVEKRAPNSSYISTTHPKKWTYDPTKLEVRYFVSKHMRHMLGVTRAKLGKSNTCYWITPIVKVPRPVIFEADLVNPSSVDIEQVEDQLNIVLDFIEDPVIGNGGKPLVLDFIQEPEFGANRFQEVVGVIDFFVPGLMRIVEVRR